MITYRIPYPKISVKKRNLLKRTTYKFRVVLFKQPNSSRVIIVFEVKNSLTEVFINMHNNNERYVSRYFKKQL